MPAEVQLHAIQSTETMMSNGIVNPGVLFGVDDDEVARTHNAPVQPAPINIDDGIPAFLRRDNNAADTSDVVDNSGAVPAVSGSDVAPVETTVSEAHAETSRVTMTEAGPQVEAFNEQETGEALNPRATIGGNNPPEDPMTREEMLREFNKDVASYGKDSGKGAAALPRLGLRVIRAAADGLISTEKPKDGDSDAVRIYKKYAEQDSKHAEHTAGGMKANAAKLNALIGLGCMTTVDGVDIAARAVAIRERMEGADLKPKALFAGLVDVARKQMDQDAPLSDEAIEEALSKSTKEKTIASEWAAIHKKVEKLVAGEGEVKDQSEQAIKIEELIREHVNNFAAANETSEKIAWLMERGMSRAQAEELCSK